MGKHSGAVCRLCRREGIKLMLKGTRCNTPKCAIEKRNYPPGIMGQKRAHPKSTDYGNQLREKQKARRIYLLSEGQFKGYVQKAVRMKGVTGENIFQLIERRLDNVIFRLGFAASRAQARQLVSHGHVSVNGRKVNIPSFMVKPNMVVSLSEKAKSFASVVSSLQQVEATGIPPWMHLNASEFKGEFVRLPNLGELVLPVNPQLIVELYSR